MHPPFVTREQIAALDELMVEHYRIPILMMMELASYRLAELVRMKYPDKNVLLCCGKGNNGGDGIAAARHLLNFGYSPKIFLISQEVKQDPAHHLKIARILKIPVITGIEELGGELENCDLVIDCLLGYNIKGAPRKEYAKVIELLNKAGKPILACDIPSGIDTDEGTINDVYVKADTILFLSLPKKGCEGLESEMFVADMGVPASLYPKIDMPEENYFEKESIITL